MPRCISVHFRLHAAILELPIACPNYRVCVSVGGVIIIRGRLRRRLILLLPQSFILYNPLGPSYMAIAYCYT